VEPAAKREGFATIPTTTWSDVGALGHVRELVERRILVNNTCLCFMMHVQSNLS
jgi:hypothetical protein